MQSQILFLCRSCLKQLPKFTAKNHNDEGGKILVVIYTYLVAAATWVTDTTHTHSSIYYVFDMLNKIAYFIY